MRDFRQTFLLRWAFLYVVSIGFQTMLPSRLQAPEFIFLCGLIYCAYKRVNIFSPGIGRLEWLVVLFFVFTGAISLFSFSREVFLQIVTHGYLLVLFFLTRHLYFVHGERFAATIKKAFLWGGVLNAALGIIGVLIFQLSGKLFLADVYYDYPYFGTVVRGMGFTTSPSMLVALCGIALLILAEEMLVRKSVTTQPVVMLIVLLCGMFVAVSKDSLMYTAGIIFLAGIYGRRKSVKTGSVLVGSLLLIVLLVSTHFTFSTQAHQKSLYTPQGDCAVFGTLHVAETGYTYLKRTAYTIGKDHLLTGVGEGNFSAAVDTLREQGKFSDNLPEYDPHSTYFGTFAETGFFGFVFLCVVICSLLRMLFKKSVLLKNNGSAAIGIIILMILYNAIWADVLNYRQLWIVLGIFSGLITFSEKHPSPAR